MNYQPPPGDGYDQLVRRVEELEQALRTVQRPTGTSTGSLVKRVDETLADIHNQVQTEIQISSYDKATIDSKILNPNGNVDVSGSLVTDGAVAAGTNLSAGGTLTAVGLATLNAGVSSSDVRSRVLTSSYAVQYVDGSGRMGTVPSARRFKQDIAPHAIDPDAIRGVQIVTFRYKAAVDDVGEDAPWCVGVIADQIDEIPALQPFVQHDDNGEISGVDYGQMVVPLIATVQDLLRRVDDLEGNA